MKLKIIVLVAVACTAAWCQSGAPVSAANCSSTAVDRNEFLAQTKARSASSAAESGAATAEGDSDSIESTKPVLLGIQAQPKKQFWFKITCPSTIDPCRTFGVWATDQKAAQAEAQRNFANCTVTPIDASQQAHACN
jgi:hypothetical protein